MTGAQALVQALKKEGVKLVYGYPGAAICPFFDALLNSSVKAVLVRQEQNAAHAASGYARITGTPGVCVVTSGPGATNLITGLATAYMDSIPLVAITGQVRSDLIGRDVFQEADITGAAEPFCKHSYLVKKAEELPRIIKEAFYIASTGRPGPVLIDLPVDIQNTEIQSEYPESVHIKGYKPSFKGHALQIKRVAEAVSKAKKPVICAGGGIFASGAKQELLAFAEKCGIPVVTTMMGIGAIPTLHPLHLGMLGTHGKFSANKAIHEADLLIIAGARVGDRAMAAPNQIANRATVIHIDIDPAEIGKNIESEIPIVGDLKYILHELFEKTQPADITEWAAYCTGLKASNQKKYAFKEGFIEPRSFMLSLSHKMASNGVLVSDVGQNQIWSANNFEITDGRFLTSGGMGTMGYSIPAAVGVKTALPAVQVVAVCGDGSFQMSMMELGTIVQHHVKIKIVIMRNNRLGMVREIQTNVYGSRYIVTTLDGNPDFIALAASYGIKARRVSDNADVQSAIDEMLAYDGTFLLECAVDPMEPSM
jgi:acetolactate synthase-1/2/3 large subunit